MYQICVISRLGGFFRFIVTTRDGDRTVRVGGRSGKPASDHYCTSVVFVFIERDHFTDVTRNDISFRMSSRKYD